MCLILKSKWKKELSTINTRSDNSDVLCPASNKAYTLNANLMAGHPLKTNLSNILFRFSLLSE